MKKPVRKLVRRRRGYADGGKVDDKGFESYIEPLARVLTDKNADYGKLGEAGTIMRGLLGPENSYETEDGKSPHPIPASPKLSSPRTRASDSEKSFTHRGGNDLPLHPNFGQTVDDIKTRRTGLAKGGKVRVVLKPKPRARKR